MSTANQRIVLNLHVYSENDTPFVVATVIAPVEMNMRGAKRVMLETEKCFSQSKDVPAAIGYLESYGFVVATNLTLIIGEELLL